ncbi:MAG: hypothetical protein H6R13_820 [Proteobacteria bacterium]|nr:hypothetical protein [Pseudomonadota bacterium]
MLRQFRSKIGILTKFLVDANEASRQGGLPWFRQFFEALLLRAPPSRLGLSEYFDYRLYEKKLTWREKCKFVGWRGEDALDKCNAKSTHIYADDKRILASMLAKAGLPHPGLAAVYQNTVPVNLTADQLQSPEELVTWLRAYEKFPLFAKPVHAGFGRGAFLLAGLDETRENLILGPTGERIRIEKWVENLTNPEGMGYLFQAALAPHPMLAELQCGQLSSLRVMILQPEESEPYIFRAVWKIPRRFNIIDNFESGSLGNLLAAVDIGSGRVLRVIHGYGLALRNLRLHPDSGLSFENLVLPEWAAIKETVLAAAKLLPEFRFQHWDVAMTDEGPVLLEINLFSAGGTELSQLVEGRGLLDSRLLMCNK